MSRPNTPTKVTNRVLLDVMAERARQELLWPDGTCAHMTARGEDLACLSVLTEEVGEVARALNEDDGPALREELVQVAAVAIAWLEGLT